MGELNASAERLQPLIRRIKLNQQDYDLETRSEEKLRLEPIIQDAQMALFRACQQESHRLRCNASYVEALDVWDQAKIHLNTSTRDLVAQEIEQLKQLQIEASQISLLITKLSRIAALRPYFVNLSKILRQAANNPLSQLLREQIEVFLLNKTPDVEGFLLWWEAEQQQIGASSAQRIDLKRLAERIKRGEIALFLGAGISEDHNQNHAVNYLAEQIGYKDFNGTLSTIAEYYQLKVDYGTSALLKQLQMVLDAHPSPMALYTALAKTTQPLILISSAYDGHLEAAFLQAGKRFVELSSMVVRSHEYDIGHVLLKASDYNPHLPLYCPEEQLSKLDLLGQGYSLIYKIRGTCSVESSDYDLLRRDALTLTESNYLNFARYAERIIPSYLARHLRHRALLFVAYRPLYWEERLLVSALLERRISDEPCYVLTSQLNPLEAAYWESRKVTAYPLELEELKQYLEGETI